MFVKDEIVKVDVIVCEYTNDDERQPYSLVLEHCEAPYNCTLSDRLNPCAMLARQPRYSTAAFRQR